MASTPTLYDLAREARVSLATASRVINGSERQVSEAYREAVLEAAARIGYRTNRAAQAVATGTSRFAALLVSDISDPFFSSIAAGVSQAAEDAQLLVSMSVTGRDADRELELLRELRGLRPRLVVLVGSRRTDEPRRPELEAELSGFADAGARIVVVGSHDLPFPSIRADDAAGAQALATALRESGRKSLAVLAGPAELAIARERASGFVAGAAGAKVRVIHGDAVTRDAGYTAAAALAQNLDGVDALFGVTDVMAIGAMTALREAGVDVPGQVAVAGFDDIPAARDANPSLTTVRIDLEALGERAVRLALADEVESEVLPSHVVLRGSTGH